MTFGAPPRPILAMDAPEKIGLIPGVLQHASHDIGERITILRNRFEASRRFARYLSQKLGAGSGRSTRKRGLIECAP